MTVKDILDLKGTFIFCPRCGSPMVGHTRPEVSTHALYRFETYDLTCRACGLTGKIEEKWRWPKEE